MAINLISGVGHPGRDDEIVVILPVALRHEEIVVAAPRGAGVRAAGMGPVFVDCAPAFFRVEEPAGSLKNLVLAMAHHPTFAVLCWLGETSMGCILVQFEATGKPADVRSRDGDLVVCAAVAGAVGAVVEHGELGTQWRSPSGRGARAARRVY